MQIKIEEESSKYVMVLHTIYSKHFIKNSLCRPELRFMYFSSYFFFTRLLSFSFNSQRS